ncbi:tyrosine-type recombinase/integrase [Rhodococcus erythropolis]
MGLPIPVDPAKPSGKKKTRARQESFGTREDAEARRDELNAARHTLGTASLADQRKAGDLPFGYYAEGWLKSIDVMVSRGALKETTAVEYRRILRCYVMDLFGGQAVASIAPRHCEDFLADLVGRGIGPNTVKHAWSAFKRVLKYALQHDAIKSNPAERVEFGGGHAVGDRDKFEHHPLTAEQVGRVAAEVGNRYPVYELLVLFLAYTGLRSAECSGLEIRDLTFSEGPHGETRCQVQVSRTKSRRRGACTTGTPKSKRSRRTVPLPSWLADKMHDFLDVHPRADEATAPLWPSRAVGGSRAKGQRAVAQLDWSEPVALGTFYETILRPAYATVGLPISLPPQNGQLAVRGVRLHDLRATFATMQLMSGVHFMQVSRWLGHGSFTLTLDTYGDWIPAEDGGAGNQLPEPSGSPIPTPVAAEPVPSNVVPLFGRRSS